MGPPVQPRDTAPARTAFHPLTGRYRCPSERTLRDAFGQVDASALARAGFARLAALAAAAPSPRTPDGVSEREQCRRHRVGRGQPVGGFLTAVGGAVVHDPSVSRWRRAPDS